ncbi:hypothetical protein MUK70_25885 [Dyadobacter chenwenxiniae]|uniref:Copper-binding protein MbnP-like domain-containing protein n=1 Tax=Dyadobacter chenwenxiniae TaxID=2906456 RepID=A0A9X1PQ34_9BACT|nr:MbnP family protein [Dyadobacter chenwenxiniae]MCF0064339.1 hypothetical protein [Dyadobacter chenwenxiniae]UON82451.1 hypothetical protein MUK70_25885 [Dyadobacter chenwenxiniae]
MKRRFSYLLLAFMAVFVSASLNSCTDDPVPLPTGSIKVKFDNVVGSQDLKLNAETYANASKENFTVSRLNYYISNIKFIASNGNNFTVPQDSSYFLIREGNVDSQQITINNVPAGNYTGIEFVIGIDSLRSVSDISKRKGILDQTSGPTNEEGMYWNWNPGYIFFMLEGDSDSATSSNGKFYYHIGGFGGLTLKTLNNIRVTKIDFGAQRATVSKNAASQINLKADILKMFNGPTKVSIKENSSVMFTPYSKNIADNYVSMFSLDQIIIK